MTVSNIKVKLPTKFPSSVSVSSPLALDTTGGAFGFSLSITDLRTTLDGYYVASASPSFSDALFILQDNSDITKQFQFQLSGITTATTRTWTVPDSSDTFVGKATTDELTNKTLTSSVGKGTWTASGTWTLPAFTLGGVVSGGGQQLNNIIIGTSTPLAGFFTVATANAFVPNLSTVPSNGMYLPAANTLGWAINSAAEIQLTSTALSPAVDGGSSLGTATNGWQNLQVNTGFILNIDNTDWVATHTTGILTVGTGDFRVTNAGTNTASVVTVGGTQTLTSKTLTNPNIVGTTAADNAAAGSVGEYVESILVSGSATSITTATDKTVTSISLTAGDWDVDCILVYIPNAATSLSRYSASLSLTTNTFDATAGRFVQTIIPATVTGALNTTITIPNYRFSLSGTTTIYMVANAAFTVNTLAAWGIIRARRVR